MSLAPRAPRTTAAGDRPKPGSKRCRAHSNSPRPRPAAERSSPGTNGARQPEGRQGGRAGRRTRHAPGALHHDPAQAADAGGRTLDPRDRRRSARESRGRRRPIQRGLPLAPDSGRLRQPPGRRCRDHVRRGKGCARHGGAAEAHGRSRQHLHRHERRRAVDARFRRHRPQSPRAGQRAHDRDAQPLDQDRLRHPARRRRAPRPRIRGEAGDRLGGEHGHLRDGA